LKFKVQIEECSLMPSTDEPRMIVVDMPADVYEAVASSARQENVSIDDFVATLLAHYLEAREDMPCPPKTGPMHENSPVKRKPPTSSQT
jgi:hypothetical protein